MLELNTIHQGDCLEVMKGIEDKSVDMILCDLPYGTTACKWDTIIPFEPLWEQYKRIIKDNGAIVLTASQPFTSALVMSNVKMFKYELIWYKDRPTGLFTAKIQPMKYHENIVVFGNRKITYNPEMWQGSKNHSNLGNNKSKSSHYNSKFSIPKTDGLKNPKSVIYFKREHPPIHPTQKPVALFEYLIKTYTNEGETVLDNCIGSGTTAIASINLNRNWIGIEISEEYCKIANERIANVKTQGS
jgi:site-specific DNA-methyltransferase (adenine-specific)